MTIFITTICVVLIFTFGFLGGVCYSAYVMTARAQKLNDSIWETIGNKKRIRPIPQQAIAVASKCWCDARTVRTPINAQLGLVVAEKIAEYIYALQWCTGSDDFAPGGKAYAGFQAICRPLMTVNPKSLDLSKLSPAQYRNIQEHAPELLGLKGKND